MKKTNYEVRFPKAEEEPLLVMAMQIINAYAEQGIMLAVTLEQLKRIAAQGLLALAVADNSVIGTAAITFVHPDGKKEFGAWAVAQDWLTSGVGKQLLMAILHMAQGTDVIAFANHNSGPIFQRYGASLLDQKQIHPDAFIPCQTCACVGKSERAQGQLCVDAIYHLAPILEQEQT